MWDAWPTPEQGTALFRRLCEGDPVASSDLLAAFLDPLVRFLGGVFPRADDHARLTAAEDALLALIRNPAVYNPAKAHLGTFLRMAARADLANALAAEGRHRRRREERDCVELAADGRNDPEDGDANDLPSFDDPDIAAVVAGLTDKQRRVLDLMRSGERSTQAAAAVLGIEHLPADEQAREVKRVKEQVFKRLQRARRES